MTRKLKFKETKFDGLTLKLEKLILEIARAAKEANKNYFIGGGFAIDLSVGYLTRNHHDIDFHPMLEDAQWWKTWFENQGYEVEANVNPKFTEVFRVRDGSEDAIVDMWPFKLEGDKLVIKFEGNYADSNRAWHEVRTINYQDINITIENPQRVLDQKYHHAIKRSEALRPQDLHDFELMGRSV